MKYKTHFELLSTNDQRVSAEHIDMAHQMASYADPAETALAGLRRELPALKEMATKSGNPVADIMEVGSQAPILPEHTPALDTATADYNKLYRARTWANILSRTAHFRALAGMLDYQEGLDHSSILNASDELGMHNPDGVIDRLPDSISPEGSARDYLQYRHGAEALQQASELSYAIYHD
jgi:hypothetical protein